MTKRNISPRGYKGKAYLFSEGMLLDGNLWVESNALNERLTECIPNIFWFDVSVSNNKWSGLCLYRLLQLLKMGPMAIDEIKRFLQVTFNYTIDIINQRFFTSISYGLIKNDYYIKSNKEITQLTEKGRFFLEFPFLDINQFYYMALDTPLSAYCEYSSSLIRFHDYIEKGLWWEFFPEAAVVSSITLIRHILQQNKLELKNLDDSLKNDFNLPLSFPQRLIARMVDGHFSALENISERANIEICGN